MGKKEEPWRTKARSISSYLPVIILIIITSMVVIMARTPDLPATIKASEEYKESGGEWNQFDPSSPTEVVVVPDEVVDDVIHPDDPPKNDTDQQNITDPDQQDQSSSESFLISALLTVAIFLPVAILGGFCIFLLFKFKKRISLKLLFSGAFGFISVATSMILLSMVIRFCVFLTGYKMELLADATILSLSAITFIPSLIVGVVLTRSIVSPNVKTEWRNVSLLALSLLIATFMTIILPWFVMVFLIIGISAWDMWAANKGIIKEIVEISEEDRLEQKRARKKAEAEATAAAARPAPQPAPQPAATVHSGTVAPAATPSPQARKPRKLGPKPASGGVQDLTLYGMYEAPNWSLGLGDLIFYSVLTAMAMTYFMTHIPFYDFYNIVTLAIVPWLVMFVVGAAVFGGFLKTLQLLEKSEILPGLPISMGLGLAAFVLLIVIMEIINLVGYGKLVPVIP